MVECTKKKFGVGARMSNLETLANRVPDRTIAGLPVAVATNPAFGVNLYKNILDADTCAKYIKILEDELGGSKPYSWLPAEPAQDTRTAVEFQIIEEHLGPESEENKALYDLNRLVLAAMKRGIDDYARSWNIGLTRYEDLNFLKYSYPNEYFGPHADDGPYNKVRTVSAVLYLNDDYEGGELHFTKLDNLTIKPEAGDLAVFPAMYAYEHESKPMLSSVKYSVVVSTDYRDRDIDEE
jgi:hypothetical protein